MHLADRTYYLNPSLPQGSLGLSDFSQGRHLGISGFMPCSGLLNLDIAEPVSGVFGGRVA